MATSSSKVQCILLAWSAWTERAADTALQAHARSSLLLLRNGSGHDSATAGVSCTISLVEDDSQWPLVSVSSSDGQRLHTPAPLPVSPRPLSGSPIATAVQEWRVALGNQERLGHFAAHRAPSSAQETVIGAVPLIMRGSLVGVLSLVRNSPGHGLSLDRAAVDHLLLLGNAVLEHLQLVVSRAAHLRSRSVMKHLESFLALGRRIPASAPDDEEPANPLSAYQIGKQVFIPTHDTTHSAESPVLDARSPVAIAASAGFIPLSRSPSEVSGNATTDVVLSATDEGARTAKEIKRIFKQACRLLSQAGDLAGAAFWNTTRTPDEDKDCKADCLASWESHSSSPDSHPWLAISMRQLRDLARDFPQGKVLRCAVATDGSDVLLSQEIPTALRDALPSQASQIAFLAFNDAHSASDFSCIVWTHEEQPLLDPDVILLAMSLFGRAAITESLSRKVAAEDLVKSRFISSVSHELRSPLHGILGGIEFLRKAELEGFEKHMLDTVQSCGRTLLDMIENVLVMSGMSAPSPDRRASDGATAGDEECFDMVNLIEDIIMSTLLGHITLQKATFSDDNSAWEADDDLGQLIHRSKTAKLLLPRLPQVVIESDWSRDWVCSASSSSVRRVIASLFANALKFTTSGHVVISAKDMSTETDRANADAPPSTHAAVVIRDTGCGMSREFLHQQAGNAFEQEDSLNSGIGLGLYLTSQVVDSIGGRIHVKSLVNAGTAVTVEIPSSRLEDRGKGSPCAVSQDLRDHVRGKTAFLLGWRVTENSRGQESLALAKNSFMSLFRERFQMRVETGPVEIVGRPDVILCDDLYFETMRADGSIDKILPSHPAFLVFCSSIRYAATMATSYPRLSFLTPPPGPNQMSKVLLRYFEPEQASEPGDCRESFAERAEHMIQRAQDTEQLMEQVQHSSEALQSPASESSLMTDPLSRQDAAAHRPSADAKTLASDTASSVEPRQSTAGPTILLVDDNPINLQLLVRFCKQKSIDYQTAKNGQQAVEAYENAPVKPSLVLMDITMPVMDGHEAARRIRTCESEGQLAPARIMALTASVSQEAVDAAYKAGCDDFMAKPAKLPKLAEIIADLKNKEKQTVDQG